MQKEAKRVAAGYKRRLADLEKMRSHLHSQQRNNGDLDLCLGQPGHDMATYKATESRDCGGLRFKDRIWWTIITLTINGGVSQKRASEVIALICLELEICQFDRMRTSMLMGCLEDCCHLTHEQMLEVLLSCTTFGSAL